MGSKKPKSKRTFNQKFRYKNLELYATPVMLSGLIITVLITFAVYNRVNYQDRRSLNFTAHEIQQQLIARLEAHALMLRAGIAYFALSDTVTRTDWREYVAHARIDRYLPDVQGIGYSMIVPGSQLEQHTSRVREEGFNGYSVLPDYARELYTSIVFVEPFTGRNRQAIGYDMLTEPVRREAMEFARDYDVATLSGRIRLERDTNGEELYGSLMFVPHYETERPLNTIGQRHEAIRGWLYSPYRLNTLMRDIFSLTNEGSNIRLQIYDEVLSDSTLLYDSYGIGSDYLMRFGYDEHLLPVNFNENRWILQFFRPRSFPILTLISLIVGIIISVLLYLLTIVFSKIAIRAQQIRANNKELKNLNATKDKFFSIIAHDLKSPYNAVLGFSDILFSHAENMDRQEIKRLSEIIRHSSESAVELLSNLMVWSQSQTGRIEYMPEKLNIADLINEVASLFVDLARQKDIVIESKLPMETFVFADREMVNTVLRNLITNAIKFTYPGGIVTVSAVKQGQELIVSVADTGIGIPEENIRDLFRIDKNYTTAGTKKEKGTGLGLILCREFVERHGGKIWVESKTTPSSESGSIFSFTLPAASV